MTSWHAQGRRRPRNVAGTHVPRRLGAEGGVKPLTDKDRAGIAETIEKILGGWPIAFRSTAVEPDNGGLTVRGELELGGRKRSASFELSAAADGRVRGTLPVTQSKWGIKPYRGMMGALKVRDTVEVVIDVALAVPASR